MQRLILLIATSAKSHALGMDRCLVCLLRTLSITNLTPTFRISILGNQIKYTHPECWRQIRQHSGLTNLTPTFRISIFDLITKYTHPEC